MINIIFFYRTQILDQAELRLKLDFIFFLLQEEEQQKQEHPLTKSGLQIRDFALTNQNTV